MISAGDSGTKIVNLLVEGENTGSRSAFVNADKGTFFQLTLELVQHRNYEVTYMVGIDILGANLKDARTLGFSCSKDCSEIQIMGENDMPICFRPGHDLTIGRSCCD